ncbi:MAG TPA: helix-turn-helix transcriptional regulator [Pirellulaceae bacterium]|nr:helix-turn-helix transcriptional regulator [Pirellulaceae bacterium]
MQRIEGDALRGHLENLILAVLARGDAHGLEILRRLETAGCGALALKEGTLYPALYRMEESGLLKAEWEDNAQRTRGPRRRIYRLSPKGKKKLAKSREQFQEFVQVIGGILGATT